MKKKIILLLTVCAAVCIYLTGCSKESAEKYVGEQLTSMKEKDTSRFAPLLEEGIAKSSENYVLEFPEELKDSYLTFMQEAFKTVDFEVSKAKEKEKGVYSVEMSFTPIEISKTVKSTDDSFLETMASTDLTAETTSLLKQDIEVIKKSPSYKGKVTSSLKVKKDGDKFSVSEKDMTSLLSKALIDYMAPYEAVCEVLDTRDFLQSYMDANLKGEFTQFMKHTGRTEEEAAAWYNDSGIFSPPADFSADLTTRYQEAMKGIMKQCRYDIKIPKKDDALYSYTVDVTVTPNTSLTEAFNELGNGTYYSTEEVSLAMVEIMEKYASSPAYGEETTMSVPLNISAYLSAGEEDADLTKLAYAILPIPE